MKTLCSLALIAGVHLLALAEQKSPVPLWPGGAPGALGKEDKDIPTLTAYVPEAGTATGAAMDSRWVLGTTGRRTRGPLRPARPARADGESRRRASTLP